MTTAFEVPLSSDAQVFAIALAGTTYKLRLQWNSVGMYWVMDVADENENPLILGTPLITGLDLLMQYGYFVIAGSLVVQTDSDTYAVPTYENLGTNGRLYFVVEP